MSIRAQGCTWIAAYGVIAPMLAVAQERTDRELLELIVRAGPQAQAIRAQADVTRREQSARLAYPNPEVEYSRESAGFTEFLQVGQAMPPLGLRAALAKAGVAATAAAEAERDARLWILRADAAAAVARLIAERERAMAARSHAGQVERLVDVLRTREKEGEGSRFDTLRAEQELREARQSVVATAIAVGDAASALSAMLPPETALPPLTGVAAITQTSPSLDALIGRASSARSELRALRSSLERANLEADAARRGARPSPTLFGGVKRADNGSGRERGGVVGLTVSLPLFDRGGREAARWGAERARIALRLAATEHEIRREVTRASAALALRQEALSGDDAEAGDELTRIAEVAYREGEVGILELLDAVRTSARAGARSVELRLDVRLARIALERAVGDILWP